jgi:hypothetical protein
MDTDIQELDRGSARFIVAHPRPEPLRLSRENEAIARTTSTVKRVGLVDRRLRERVVASLFVVWFSMDLK